MISYVGVQDPLVALVMLHSTFNAFGLILFYPFINYLADFLERSFMDVTNEVARFIHKLTPEVPEAAIPALDQEVHHLFHKALLLVTSNFDVNAGDTFTLEFKKTNEAKTFKQQYKSIKQLEGEMFQFYTQLQQQRLDPEDNDRLSQLINAIRYLLHASKGAKDVHKNLRTMGNSTHKILNQLFLLFEEGHLLFYEELKKLLDEETSATLFEELTELVQKNQTIYENLLDAIYRDLYRKKLTQIEISTVLNVNRELYSSRKALILALKEFRLNFQESQDFQQLPMVSGS
jgi:phosphate:Na+ symporter